MGLALLGPAEPAGGGDLERRLREVAMTSELYAGDLEAAKGHFEAARARLRSSEERTNLAIAWIEVQSLCGLNEGAIRAGSERLRDLGFALRSDAGQLAVFAQYLRARIARRGRSREELLEMGELQDPRRAEVLAVLGALEPPAYATSENLFGWIVFETAALSMRYGLSRESAFGFMSYGVMIAGLGDVVEGEALGRMALALDRRLPNDALGPRLHVAYGALLASWVRPFHDAEEHGRIGAEIARRRGDTLWERYAVGTLAHLAYCGGVELSALEAASEHALRVEVLGGSLERGRGPLPWARYARVLRGATDEGRDRAILARDGDAREDAASTEPALDIFGDLLSRGELAYFFGETARAAAFVARAKRFTRIVLSIPMIVDLCLLDVLVGARSYGEPSKIARPRLHIRMHRCAQRLTRWAERCPENFEAHALLACAELARIGGEATRAAALYARALRSRLVGTARRSARRSPSSSPRSTPSPAGTRRAAHASGERPSKPIAAGERPRRRSGSRPGSALRISTVLRALRRASGRELSTAIRNRQASFAFAPLRAGGATLSIRGPRV